MSSSRHQKRRAPLKKRYLITGGAGFIGSHLAQSLVSAGEQVTVVDDLSTGSLENISELKDAANFRCVIASIGEEPMLADLMRHSDVVFHLAAAVGVRLIIESPVRTIFTNVQGTDIVLRLADEQRKPVILTSTSEVYGKSTQATFREDNDLVLGPPTKGRWSYACSKAIDEFLAMAYFKEKSLPVTIVRPFNIVGPRQTGRYGMVIPTFVRQAIRAEPITVYGDGNQSRCFLHVRDAVWALIRLAHEPRAVGEIFNVGNPDEITINDLARLIRDMAGSRSPLVHVPYDRAYDAGFEDMRRRVPDIGKVSKLTGFRPTRDLRGIIRDLIHSMRGSLAEPTLTAPPATSQVA
jgi:UDP-glucose 4-epimerase